MKKIITLLLALAGMVSTASAEDYTFRVYVERQANWGNDVYVFVNYWNGTNNVTLIDNQQMTWIAKSRVEDSKEYHLFYTDITIDKAILNGTYGVKINFNNGASTKTWTENNNEIKDFTTKNYLFFIYQGGDSKYYMSNSNYTFIFAKVASNTLSNTTVLTPSNNILTTEIDNEESPTDADYILYPSFATEYFTSDQYGNCVNWNLILRPKVISGDYEISNFQTYSDDLLHGASNGLFRNQLQAKLNFTFNLSTMKFSIAPYRTATIGDAGYITWSNDEKYTISGATAYAVKNMGTYAKLTAQEAGIVYPAGTGLVLGGSGEVTISAVASDAATASISNNDLLGSGNNGLAIAAGCYVLYWDGENPSSVGFSITQTGTLGAHKAYLPTTNSRSFLAFEEDITGINEVSAATDNGAIFNLQGVRLNKMQKGLNVVNGKKVMVK